MFPKAYEWLADEPGPKMVLEALKLFGTHEGVGPEDNPVVLGWAKELDLSFFRHDDIAWCGLFVAICAKRADKPLPANPLWARDWLNWGGMAHTPMLGDVMVFPRGTGGHVALYVGEDATHYHILGGNQSDQVSIVRKPKQPFLGARRLYRFGQPSNVRVIKLAAGGTPSSVKEN